MLTKLVQVCYINSFVCIRYFERKNERETEKRFINCERGREGGMEGRRVRRREEPCSIAIIIRKRLDLGLYPNSATY